MFPNIIYDFDTTLHSRFVLADTSQLHTKIAEMGQRIRQLEDALSIFQSGVSNEVHPLLRDDLLSVKFGPDKGYVPEKEPPTRSESLEPVIDAFGTMTVGDSGEGKYFGPSAGSEVRVQRRSLNDGFLTCITPDAFHGMSPSSASYPLIRATVGRCCSDSRGN